MTTTPTPGARRRILRALGAGLAMLSLAGVVSCGAGQKDPSSLTTAPQASTENSTAPALADTSSIDGVEFYSNLSGEHVTTPVAYEQSPAVGGDHSPVWTNCGIYTKPVEQMRAVHSMEHGAVWITYRPDLPAAQLQKLTKLAGASGYVLLSPYPAQATRVAATAWGVQLALDTADDPRLQSFLRTYVQGEQTPEPGAPCTGGVDG